VLGQSQPVALLIKVLAVSRHACHGSGSLVAMGVAMTRQLSGKTPESLFIGLWAVTYLLLGVCNKLVKGVELSRSRGQFPEAGTMATIAEIARLLQRP